jgi:uncharacterized membrane protein YraQ (UPF0718 family)
MIDQILTVVNFMIEALLHIWPYLLITIPIAVAVRISGAANYISGAFQARPVIAIFFATAVGAFSPFCSCSVIPVVATLLIGGVPLAPVMSFWIASPSMDPEIFFLSVPMLGWELAVWRLVATLILSLSAGLLTHLVVQGGWLGQGILRNRQPTSVPVRSSWVLMKAGYRRFRDSLTAAPILAFAAGPTPLASEAACCNTGESVLANSQQSTVVPTSASGTSCGCSSSAEATAADSCAINKPVSFRRRLLGETWSATLMVAKFMALAFLLEALIILYVPSTWIAGLLGHRNQWAIVNAALIGVPVYTTELAALPMVSGLLAQGMNPAAALAFLIAGPTTTLPAMTAVWGLVTRRVFALYLSFSLLGAIGLGYLYNLVTILF